jgi:hypothetical protein
MLMPAHDIRSHFTWRSGLADFAQLKLHGRVSMASLIRRAHDLKVITDGHYTNLQRQMSGAGYRRCEPNEFEPEQPTTIREMVRVHVEDLGFTASELATLTTKLVPPRPPGSRRATGGAGALPAPGGGGAPTREPGTGHAGARSPRLPRRILHRLA